MRRNTGSTRMRLSQAVRARRKLLRQGQETKEKVLLQCEGWPFPTFSPASWKSSITFRPRAPAGHRAESRPDIRLVGTVTGRRFETPERSLESTGISEPKLAFPCRSTLLPVQVRCRRIQADIGPRLAATPDLRRMAVSPTHPHSLDWEKIQRKGPHHAGLFVQRRLRRQCVPCRSRSWPGREPKYTARSAICWS
ncbi:MAG: hypothetical protein KA124_11055, partial [Luteimonas sp.]|nr:hypothetical protein [Luteimonas sp.]